MKLLCTWLVWLVALALPLQGVAAATMLHCVQHAAAVQGPVAHDPVDGAHAQHAGEMAAAHHAAPDHNTPIAHTCSACALCCVGAALPVQMVSWTAPVPEHHYLSFDAVRPVAPPLAAFERPPRTAHD